MRRWLLLLLLFGLCLTTFTARAQENEELTDPEWTFLCPYEQGVYYSQRLAPRYEIRNNRIVLVSWITGDIVAELENSILVEMRFEPVSWSPDCRYIAAKLEPYGHFMDGEIIFWDTVEGTRAHTFDHPYKGNSRYAWFNPATAWSPDAQQVVVRTTNGYYLWKPVTDEAVLLVHPSLPYYGNPDLKHVYWDKERNFVVISGYRATAYDLTTGIERIVFRGDNFVVSPDQTKIISFFEGGSTYLAIWDLDSSVSTLVPSAGIVANRSQVTISDDNRYLVAGRDAIRVWDLQNLLEKVEDRLPVYRHGGPQARIWSVRFAAPEVIETTSEEGTQRWDLHTGAYIP